MATRAGTANAQQLLRNQPLFRRARAGTLERLAAVATRHTLRRGRVLFSAGERPTGLYVVVYGALRLVAGAAGGERQTGIVRAGSSLGEAVMFLDRPTPVAAVACEDSLVLHLPREAVLDELAHDPAFALHMLEALSRRIERLVLELEHQTSGTARSRVLRYLESRAAGARTLVLPTSKAAIASELHITPEHFSRVLRGLRSDGVIAVDGREVAMLRKR